MQAECVVLKGYKSLPSIHTTILCLQCITLDYCWSKDRVFVCSAFCFYLLYQNGKFTVQVDCVVLKGYKFLPSLHTTILCL
jgi:hypothetical protein